MTVVGVLMTFGLFIGLSWMLGTMSRKERDIEHPEVYRNARYGTKI